jgi:zinc transport system substrate-binding protein
MTFRTARLGFGFLTMLASATTTAAFADAPKVVVTIKPIHALVSQIMRGVATPTLLVEGAASPHTFTLKPSTARAINEAGVFIRISDTLEPFTRKISQSLPPNVSLLTLAGAPGIALLDRRHGGTFERHTEEAGTEHHDHDEDEDGGKDGHIWLDPANAKAIVAVVTKTLAERYPEHANTFAENATALDTRLDALDGELASTLAGVRGKPFILFHDATQYLERRYGLSAAGSITVSPDVPPSARRLTEVRRKISSLGAVCVFAEPDFQPDLVAAVTEGTEARTGTLDAEGQLLSPGPDLYFDLMRGVARSLASCLSKGS